MLQLIFLILILLQNLICKNNVIALIHTCLLFYDNFSLGHIFEHGAVAKPLLGDECIGQLIGIALGFGVVWGELDGHC